MAAICTSAQPFWVSSDAAAGLLVNTIVAMSKNRVESRRNTQNPGITDNASKQLTTLEVINQTHNRSVISNTVECESDHGPAKWTI